MRQLIRDNPQEQVIVFRNAKGPAEGCAAYLANELGLPPATAASDSLPGHDLSTSSVALRACLRGGTAFHTANLSREEREVVERAYRQKDGGIRAVAATTTVAAGINTPASTVILAEQEFKGDDGRPFTVAEYKNMAGRAGRLGYNEVGRAIIYANDYSQREALFQKYVLGQLEPIRSSFDGTDLGTWILRLLAQVKHVARHDLVRVLANTYGGYLANRRNPQWQARMRSELEQLVSRMINARLVEVDADTVRLSLLGRACGRSSLRLESSMRLIAALQARQHQNVAAETLMAMIQGLPEMDAVYTPVQRKGTAEGRWTREVAQRFGIDVAVSPRASRGHDGVLCAASVPWCFPLGLPGIQWKRSSGLVPLIPTTNSGRVIFAASRTRPATTCDRLSKSSCFSSLSTRRPRRQWTGFCDNWKSASPQICWISSPSPSR